MPNVQDCAGQLLLVGEGELDGGEGDVEALEETLLAEGEHHRSVGVSRQAGGDEASLHLVVDLVLNLKVWEWFYWFRLNKQVFRHPRKQTSVFAEIFFSRQQIDVFVDQVSKIGVFCSQIV